MYIREVLFGYDFLSTEHREVAIKLIKRVTELATLPNQEILKQCPKLAEKLNFKE